MTEDERWAYVLLAIYVCVYMVALVRVLVLLTSIRRSLRRLGGKQ